MKPNFLIHPQERKYGLPAAALLTRDGRRRRHCGRRLEASQCEAHQRPGRQLRHQESFLRWSEWIHSENGAALRRLTAEFSFRKTSVAAAPRPSLSGIAGAIVVAETTVLAAATLASPAHDGRREEEGEEGRRRDRQVQVGEEGAGTPAAGEAGPPLDIQGANLTRENFTAHSMPTTIICCPRQSLI